MGSAESVMQECVYWKAVMDIDELEERLTKTRPRSGRIIDQAIDLWRDRINAFVRTQRQTLPNTCRDALLRDVNLSQILKPSVLWLLAD